MPQVDSEALIRAGRVSVDASLIIRGLSQDPPPDHAVGAVEVLRQLQNEGRVFVAAPTLVEVVPPNTPPGDLPRIRGLRVLAFDTTAAQLLLRNAGGVPRGQRFDAMGVATAARWRMQSVVSCDQDWHDLAPLFGLRCIWPRDLLARTLL